MGPNKVYRKNMQSKRCTKCGFIKPLGDFYNKAKPSIDKAAACKKCDNARGRAYYLKNKDKILASQQKHRANPETKVCRSIWAKMYYQKSGIKARSKVSENRYRSTPVGKAKKAISQKKYMATEKGKIARLAGGKKYRIKYRTNLKNRLNRNIGNAIYQNLKGFKRGRHWENLVKWTLQQLKNRFVQLFEPGMTWDNYGEWHIDHKIPISAFNFTKPENLDFKRCWALSNLQPMWAKENISKGAKLDKPFQPSLRV